MSENGEKELPRSNFMVHFPCSVLLHVLKLREQNDLQAHFLCPESTFFSPLVKALHRDGIQTAVLLPYPLVPLFDLSVAVSQEGRSFLQIFSYNLFFLQPGYRRHLCPLIKGLFHFVCLFQATEMSTIGSFEGFQPVSLKQEGDHQPSETDHLAMDEGDSGKKPGQRRISRQPSVTKSTLCPNPYHQPYASRKYFATRVKP